MPIEDMIRIDNAKEELTDLLGEDFLDYQLSTESFAEGITVEEFWKESRKGTFMLLTASKKQPTYGAPSVHITILDRGAIRRCTPNLLKKKLLGVQRVTPGLEMVN
jgi:hypothetical protein